MGWLLAWFLQTKELMAECIIMAACAWSFVGNDAVILPLLPLGTVVTIEVVAVVRDEI